MMYHAFEAYQQLLAPWRSLARSAALSLSGEFWPPSLMAAVTLFGEIGLTHKRPPFGIDTALVGNRAVPVHEEVVLRTPFGSLIHFVKDDAAQQPRVLIVAPLSGHFATLLRGTVRTMLADHDVYITDWHDAREIPLSQGWFDLDDFVEHLIRFIELLGVGTHVVAICQPAVAALAATAIMAEEDHPAVPLSLTWPLLISVVRNSG
jgi:poly(3-hydroxybutyrate) depolymerase